MTEIFEYAWIMAKIVLAWFLVLAGIMALVMVAYIIVACIKEAVDR